MSFKDKYILLFATNVLFLIGNLIYGLGEIGDFHALNALVAGFQIGLIVAGWKNSIKILFDEHQS